MEEILGTEINIKYYIRIL